MWYLSRKSAKKDQYLRHEYIWVKAGFLFLLDIHFFHIFVSSVAEIFSVERHDSYCFYIVKRYYCFLLNCRKKNKNIKSYLCHLRHEVPAALFATLAKSANLENSNPVYPVKSFKF